MRYALRTAVIAVALLTLAPAGVFASHDVCQSGDDSGEWPYLCLVNNQPRCSDVLPANAHFVGWGTNRCRTSDSVTCQECGTNGHSGCQPCKSYDYWECDAGYVQSGGSCIIPCSPNQGNSCSPCNSCGACASPAGTIQCNGSCNVGPPPLSACGTPPTGSHDVADCTSAWGWAFDPDYAGSDPVHIYVDGVLQIPALTANMSRPDVGAIYPGRTNSGWSWPIPPSLKNGLPHSILAYPINVNALGAPQGPNTPFSNSPRSITCIDLPMGSITSAACGTASGTATDAQGSPVAISIRDGSPTGPEIGTGNATPNFTVGFAPFINGQTHTLYALARDVPSGTWGQLPGSQTVSCAPTVTLNAAPATVGFASSTTLSWTVSNGISCTGSPTGWFNAGTVVNGVGSGSASSGPLTGTTTFTLTCTNAAGQSAMASRTVTVNAPPPTASVVNVSDTNYCTVGPGMVIDWRYESVARPIGAYQVQVLRGATVVFDTGKASRSASLPLPPLVQEESSPPLSPWTLLRATILDLLQWMFGEEAQACHGDCGYGGDGCQQACDEGGMGGLPWCIDPPGNGYGTGWDIGKRDSWCAGSPSCRETWRCYTDFGCNSGYRRCGDACCEDTPPPPTPPPCTPGGACTSSPNICGMTNGTRLCPSGCAPPPPSACPPPTCSANPTPVALNGTVTATGAGGYSTYVWNSGGGTPTTTSGNPVPFTYPTSGPKQITVTAPNGKFGTCNVTVCASGWPNTTCTSAPNGCGLTTSAFIQCDGTCGSPVVTPPPNSACPPPSCSVTPSSVNAGVPVTATGASGVGVYSWTSSGVLPTGSGPSYTTPFDSTGTKTISVTDSNTPTPKTGTCNVNVGASYITTGTVSTPQGAVTFSTAYTIRVKVWDLDNRESAWSADFPYTTKPGPWPVADFTFSPTSPFAQLPVQFTDASQNGPTGWLWDFGDGQGAATQNPAHAYAAEGSYSVMLQATNAAGTCSVTKTLEANKPLPRYREVRPGTQSTQTPASSRTPTPSPRGNEQPPPPPPGGPNSDL